MWNRVFLIGDCGEFGWNRVFLIGDCEELCTRNWELEQFHFHFFFFLCLYKANKILHFTNPQKNPWGKVAGDNRHGQNSPTGMSGMAGDNSSPGIFLRICK